MPTEAIEDIKLTPGELVMLPIGALNVHPKLEYRLEDKAALADLADSITRLGLIHNLAITPERVIVSGTRRYGALKLRNHSEAVRCVVVPSDVGEQMAIALAANGQVQAPDPMRDAELVATLMASTPDRPAWTVREVATAMGWEPRRVALLRQLEFLAPKVKEALETENHYMRNWPLEWIESFAVLSPDAQVEALDTKRFQFVQSAGQLDMMLAQHFHVLGKAPWDINDEELVPEAGACSRCTKHSGHTPGLFDDDLDASNVKDFVCQDSVCWLKKTNACAVRKIADARAKNPDTAIVVGFNVKSRLPVLDKEPVYDAYSVQKCGKSEKGAVPAIEFKEDGSIHRVYIQPPSRPAAAPKGGKSTKVEKTEKSEAEKNAERRERLKTRRLSFVVNTIIAAVRERVDPPTSLVLKGLIAAYAVEQPMTDSGYPRNIHGSVKSRMELYELLSSDAWEAQVWGRLKRDIVASISATHPGVLEEEFEEAVWIAEIVLGLDRKKLWADAEEAIPAPKTIEAKKLAKEKPAKKEPAKKEPAKKKVAKEKVAKGEPVKRRNRAEDGFQPE